MRTRLASRRVLAQAFGIGGVERQRLLDKHVFAGGDRFLGQGKMLDRGRRDGDCVNSWVSKYIVPGTHADAVFLGRPRSCLAVAIANRRQGAQLGEIPHQVLAPMAAARDSDVRRSGFCFGLAHELWARARTARASLVTCEIM